MRDVSRRTLGNGFACEQNDACDADHRGKETTTLRQGVTTDFLASSSVHGHLLADVIARANADPTIMSAGFARRARSRASEPVIQKYVRVSRQSDNSNDLIDNNLPLSKRKPPNRRDESDSTAVALCGM
jgi:hypothetical protein